MSCKTGGGSKISRKHFEFNSQCRVFKTLESNERVHGNPCLLVNCSVYRATNALKICCPTSRAELGLEMRKTRAWTLIIILPNQFAVTRLHCTCTCNTTIVSLSLPRGKQVKPDKSFSKTTFFFWSLHWNERKQAQTTVSLRNNVFVEICCLYYYVIIMHGRVQAKPDQS